MKTWEKELHEYQEEINIFLVHLFEEKTPYSILLEAMRYSLLAGGKRIRPALCIAFSEALTEEHGAALQAGCAVELLHTYSLIHDDLPCMDNSDLRRGRPTCHKQYGYANALLAGDALLTAAFRLLSEIPSSPEMTVRCVQTLAKAAGEHGMVAGQVLDLMAEKNKLDASQLAYLSGKKTGALISAACTIGTILGGGGEKQIAAAQAYGKNIGLAFQIRDDVLDVVGTEASTGKTAGTDQRNGKDTFASALGLAACREKISGLTKAAIEAVENSGFAYTDFLVQLARGLATRTK